jgi:hypothetical protein
MADELLFTVAGSSAKRATPISLAEAGLRERQDLQEWVLEHPEILGPGVMVVTFEFDRWWSSSGNQPLDRLDVLGLDDSGTLVVAELKRDRAPDTVEMQAIKYAAMASRFTLESLGSQHARFRAARGRPCTDDEALASLAAHAEEMTAESLRRPRIVLLASDYPPVVTATVVWLTEMSLDVTLMKFQAYRTETETLLSVSQVYPVPDIEEFTVSPRQAEVRAAVETKKRTQDTSAVRRLVDAGSLEDGTEFRLRTRTEVNAEVRTAIETWVAEDPDRGKATWQNKAGAPLIWASDGHEYTPSGLVKHIISLTSGIDRSVQGTKWWVDAGGQNLVELSASGKRQHYLAFWGRFLERLRQEHPDWSRSQIPQPESWFSMPAQLRGAAYGVNFAQGGRMRSELYIDSGDAQKNLELFRALQAERAAIEAAYGEPLHWEELPTKQACRLTDYAEGDVSNLDQHDSYIDWFFDASQRLRDAIGAAGVATLRIQ